MWGVPLPVDPGSIVVEASAPGYAPRRGEVKAIGEGKTITFKVPALSKKGSAVAAPAVEESAPAEEEPAEDKVSDAESPAASEAAPEQASPQGRSPWPYVLGGVGLAAAGAGTYFAFAYKQADDDARALCQNDVCTSQEFADWELATDDARLNRTLAYVGWGVGGAALAGAVIWFIADTPQAESAVHITPLVGSKSWGLGAHGRF
jgi:hypothetical protein